MSRPPFFIDPALQQINKIRHGFFTRVGGVSSGLFTSLNCSFSSEDATSSVYRNREIVRQTLVCDQLITLRQIHSNQIHIVDDDFDVTKSIEGDGLVTQKRGVALGVLGADCAPVLFASKTYPVIGVAHCGWQGALKGVTHSVIQAFVTVGVKPIDVVAVIGPTIAQRSYEVGEDFFMEFKKQSDVPVEHCFMRTNTQHFQFNLPLYIEEKIKATGIKAVFRIQQDTYSAADKFFSYRRSCHQNEPYYGRHLSAICLK